MPTMNNRELERALMSQLCPERSPDAELYRVRVEPDHFQNARRVTIRRVALGTRADWEWSFMLTHEDLALIDTVSMILAHFRRDLDQAFQYREPPHAFLSRPIPTFTGHTDNTNSPDFLAEALECFCHPVHEPPTKTIWEVLIDDSWP